MAVTSKVKGQGHKLTSSVRLISASFEFGKQNAVTVLLEAGGGILLVRKLFSRIKYILGWKCVFFYLTVIK